MAATRAGIYLRVSSRDQSHDSQRQVLLDYVKARGWTLAGEFTDTVVGVARQRPGLDALNAAVHKRQLDVVVVFRFDRFARSLAHLVLALEAFNAAGVGFVSVNDPVDTTTPTGKAMFAIIGAFAELERSILSERVQAGMAAARARGTKVGRPAALSRDDPAATAFNHHAEGQILTGSLIAGTGVHAHHAGLPLPRKVVVRQFDLFGR